MQTTVSMRQIAISTGSLSRRTPEALERAADLGFSHVEVNLQPDEFGYDYRRKPNARFYRELRKQLDGLGLSVWSVTPPPLSQAQMFSTKARRDILLNGAAAAGILGSKVYAVQPADLFQDEDAFQAYAQRWHAPPMVDGFDETWAQVVNRQMTLALVNVDYWLGAVLTNQADRLAKITNDLAIGSALDVRRALHRNTLPAWLECIGDRLAVAYLYDVQDDGRLLAPAEAAWQEWLPPLRETRLKCLVLHAGPTQSETEILSSREMIQRIVR